MDSYGLSRCMENKKIMKRLTDRIPSDTRDTPGSRTPRRGSSSAYKKRMKCIYARPSITSIKITYVLLFAT
jgi:hypothetical protein